ncbi:hypothetical protein D3C74_333090 [compost metagenome]
MNTVAQLVVDVALRDAPIDRFLRQGAVWNPSDDGARGGNVYFKEHCQSAANRPAERQGFAEPYGSVRRLRNRFRFDVHDGGSNLLRLRRYVWRKAGWDDGRGRQLLEIQRHGLQLGHRSDRRDHVRRDDYR